jgi:hypothetical protein
MSNTIKNISTEKNSPETDSPTPEVNKEERITHLLKNLAKAHDTKDTRFGKKIRRQLRKLGYYISKQVKIETPTEEVITQ